MNFLPVASRELRVIARRREMYWVRFTAAAAALAIAWFMLVVSRGVPGAVQAQALFAVLSGFALIFALVCGVRTTADCLSEEKRKGTLGLLFLTDLRAADIIAGKVLASSASALAALVALLPVLALPLLLGGVPADVVWKMALLQLNTMFLSLAAGVMVSALCRHAQRAMGLTFLVILAVAAGPFVLLIVVAAAESEWLNRAIAGLALWLPAGRRPVEWIVIPSPVSGLVSLLTGTFRAPGLPSFGSYWGSMAAVHGLTWLFLGVALYALPRTWRERNVARSRRGRAAAARAADGEGFATREAALEPLPFAWIVLRQKRARHVTWMGLAVAAGLWLWGAVELEEEWLNASLGVTVAATLGGWVKLQLAAAATAPFFEQRRSGALELVLCTHQTPAELVAGHLDGLRRQFMAPLLVVAGTGALLLSLAMAFDPDFFDNPAEILATFAVWLGFLFFDAVTIAHAGMWEGLAGRQLSQAIGQAALKGIFLHPAAFGLGWAATAMLTSLLGVGLGDLGFWTVLATWVALGVACNLWVLAAARRGLRERLRELALEHYGPAVGDRAGWVFRRWARALAGAGAGARANSNLQAPGSK